MKIKYSHEELLQLKNLADKLRLAEGRSTYPLTEELLRQLTQRVIESRKHFPNSTINSIFDEAWTDACGCLGPRDDELFCGCRMIHLIYEYRYDVALELINQGYKCDPNLRQV